MCVVLQCLSGLYQSRCLKVLRHGQFISPCSDTSNTVYSFPPAPAPRLPTRMSNVLHNHQCDTDAATGLPQCDADTPSEEKDYLSNTSQASGTMLGLVRLPSNHCSFQPQSDSCQEVLLSRCSSCSLSQGCCHRQVMEGQSRVPSGPAQTGGETH